MKSETSTGVKNFINQAILLGVIGMAVAFLMVLYAPKKYLIVGKLVVYPASLNTAEQNLGYEVGNTVQIINSAAFKTSAFQGASGNFAYAKQLGDSSTIAIAFYAQSDERMLVEDSIVRVPMALADYTRDLYSGMPFKYRLLSDPEISTGPVKPNIAQYLISGFGMGVLLYLLYWFLFEFLRVSDKKEMEDASKIVSPSMKPVKSEKPVEKKIGGGKVEMKEGRPHFLPGEKNEGKPSAPENLPFVDEAKSYSSAEEPSDDEVKERLNRLMRGEL